MTALAPPLAIFLREHLPRDRRASPHTCEAYAYSFQLLVTFAARRLRTKPSQLEVEQLDVPMILAFLEHIEQDRGNKARSRKFLTSSAQTRRKRPTPGWPQSSRSSTSWNIACRLASIRLCGCTRSR
jgi:site-specific recombinase XerC